MNSIQKLPTHIIDKPVYFEFETDFVDTLRCIPMIVRYKLDRSQVKLQLAHWAKFRLEQKDLLAQTACHSGHEARLYASLVQALVRESGYPPAKMLPPVEDSWNVLSHIPDGVAEKAIEWEDLTLSLFQWQKLSTLERFALVKLSRSGHEGANFPRALREFGIIS